MRALIALALLVACKHDTKAPPPAPAPTPPPVAVHDSTPAELARGANQLALQLWPHLPAGNLVFSPATTAMSLAILWGGAKGSTATQLASALGITGSPDIVLGRWGNMATALGKDIKLATRLFGDRAANIDTTYFTIVRHAFDVWIDPIDIATAREKINAWISEQTDKAIPELVGAGVLSPATKLVVASAPWFIANMNTNTPVRSASDQRATLVEIDLGATALYVVRPATTLEALEPALGATLKDLEPRLVPGALFLAPSKTRVALQSPLELSAALQAIGVHDAFEPTADFTGLATANVFVSSVIEDAAVSLGGLGMTPPYVFLVVHRATGLFAFMGRVVN